MEGLDLKALIQNINLIAEEKELPEEKVISIIEEAIAAAWRRDNGEREWKVRGELNINTGGATVYRLWDVVEEVEDEATQLTIEDAREYKKDAKFGDVVEEKYEISTLGRVAAQTAKQVVIQKIREAEREIVFADYTDKIGSVINGTVARTTGRVAFIEIGRANAIMPTTEQIPGEFLRIGDRIKVYLKDIERDERGTQMIVSRADANFVRELFRAEVPELDGGTVEIKGIAREAGKRTKIAVASSVPGVDPVGTFVGGRGIRINAVTDEINNEKIDIVIFDEDIKNYIANAIAPAEISKIELNEEENTGKIFVTEDQQSIAIGKGGQNVRLASKLTGYELDIEVAEAPKTKKIVSSKVAESSLVDLANSDEDSEEEE